MSSLLSDNLLLLEEWHPTKNSSPPGNLTAGSGKKVWWLSSCGHEYEARIAHRSSGSGCPMCKSHKVVYGVNDLATTHPELAKQWHPTKNFPSTAKEVTANSSKKVWWVGECGHEWETTVLTRKAGSNCPYCAGSKTLAGFNDLATTHPELAEQWVADKNEKLITTISAGSRYKATWQCAKTHQWSAVVKNRTIGRGCPYCSNSKRFEGLNDLPTLYPEIAEQWNLVKNQKYDIAAISVSSPIQVWWKCSKNHEWFSSVKHRTRNGENCPICYQSSGTSQMEQDLFDYLNEETGDIEVFSRFRNGLPFELDIYIPKKNLAVEFNGVYWHSEENGKDSNYHLNKYVTCKDKGIQLIQVWEDDWKRNPELIKQMLTHKLGLNTHKIYARNTVVKEISQQQVSLFLTVNHIQGAATGSIKLGLFPAYSDSTEPVAVMVLKQEPGTGNKTLNLLRFATSINISGGFTKLLKYVERAYNPENIVTFSDNTVSNGNLYAVSGFEIAKRLKPDYMYVVKGERKHKFGYRLKRFRQDSTLKFVEGLTEQELAKLNNLPRIWDAGKVKWVKRI